MRHVLNPSLEEITPRSIPSLDDLSLKIANHLGGRVYPVRFPADGEIAAVHGNIYNLLTDAYNRHWEIAIAPHDLWYLVLTEIAGIVHQHPDTYRAIFSKAPSRTRVAVFSEDPSALPLSDLVEILRPQVPVDTSLFIPEFSTHTYDSELACMAAFCGMLHSYFDYGVFSCGIRAVEILGTVDDWQAFVERLERIGKVMETHPEWFSRMSHRVSMIRDSLAGGESEFIRDIYTHKNVGSGGQLWVNGWITEFIANPEFSTNPIHTNFPLSWSVVAWENLATEQRYTDVHGSFFSEMLEASRVRAPQYGRFTFKRAEDADDSLPQPAITMPLYVEASAVGRGRV